VLFVHEHVASLDGSRVVESGTHEALMARGGQYAEWYGIQAAATAERSRTA
jgi:ATP-binding cassette subfamily B protein